jgi:P-type E1-E2 ATPase
VNGREVLVGRRDLLAGHNVEIPKNVAETSSDKTKTFVAIDHLLAGIITFEDQTRDESRNTIHTLEAQGIPHTYLVTGDSLATAKSVAKQVGIRASNIIANALPVDKLRIVEQSNERPIGFVGDGVNDAPVLVAADVGVALGAKGSTAASQSADIVIMRDDIAKVAEVHAIALRTFKIARQSILVGIGLSIGLMVIFATGKFKPIYGAAIQELVDVTVIFNALRAHVGDRKN